MSDRFTLRVAVFTLLIKDGEILLLRRKNTGWHDGSYDMPTGHIEGRERLTTAACREAREEVGVNVNEADMKLVTFFHSFFPEDGREYIYVFFEANRWQGEPRVAEPDKCDEIRWFDVNDLPQNLTPGTRDGLKAYKAKVPFAESGF